jgi:hypothetical protein
MSGTDDAVDAKFNVIPIFKGAKKDYIEWYRSFMAIADMKDCAEALSVKHAAVLPDSLDSKLGNDAAGKAADRAIKQNKVAMALLNVALKGEAMGNVILKSQSTEWPHGLAYKVMEALELRFNPSGIDKTVELDNKLAAIAMKKKDDPGDTIDCLEGISARYTMLGLAVDPQRLIAKALVVAPAEYNAALIGEKRCHGDERMNDVYATLYGEAAKHAAKAAGKLDDGEKKLL